MKKTIKILALFLILAFIASPLRSYASEDVNEEIDDDMDTGDCKSKVIDGIEYSYCTKSGYIEYWGGYAKEGYAQAEVWAHLIDKEEIRIPDKVKIKGKNYKVSEVIFYSELTKMKKLYEASSVCVRNI